MTCPIKSDKTFAFEIFLDVQHFVREQIKVTTEDHQILVNTRHGVLLDNSYESRHSVRRYPLPIEFDEKSVISKLGSDGILHITANKKL